jgi:HSP20 family protein
MSSGEGWDVFDEIERMFDEINKEFEEEFDKMMKRFRVKPAEFKGKRVGPVVYGWSMVIGPDGKPVVRQFGNVAPRMFEGEREPLVDVNDSPEEVSVVAEMPGVDKSEIKLNATENSIEVRAPGKYYKQVELPTKVIPDKAKASYKNGVLEVRLPKKEKRETPGTSIPIE